MTTMEINSSVRRRDTPVVPNPRAVYKQAKVKGLSYSVKLRPSAR